MAAFFAAVNPYVLLWLVLVIAFIVVELITVGLTSIWFAAGALVAFVVAICGGHPLLQMILFLAVSLVLLAATRPWARRFVNSRMQKTNADSIIGENIRIGETVDNLNQTGSAIVRGQEWMVRAADDNQIFAQGELARVVAISGVKLIVEKIKEE